MKKFLTEFRYRLLIWAIKQWTEKEMDQWEYFSIQTKYGKVFTHLAYVVERAELYDEAK